MKILSIQIGQPKELKYNNETFMSGIFKYPVKGKVQVNKLSLGGDGQADLSVHGGADKAIYAYSTDTYSWWKKARGLETLAFGAMGENISFDHLPEDKIYAGDIFEIGETQIQVTEPRFPCFKLAAMYNDAGILKQFMQLNRPGIYFRVLKVGTIEAGMEMKLLSQESTLVSVQEMFEFKNKSFDQQMAKKMLEVKSLNLKWRDKIEAGLV